ncbi:hypothetical protein [Hamadaea tsunoensis]|uniref:hypothetical protein n=1 Tax=Hamadaea tsunoensis TaxID=53368 RepID=UPI000411D50F|nr:hypothetical protein [Hamadaea tsunoensis]
MSKLLRRLAAPIIALTMAAGALTHVQAAGAALVVAEIPNCDQRLEQFANINDTLYHRWQLTAGGSWSGWVSMNVWMLYYPAAARNKDCRLEVYWINPSHEMLHMWQDGAKSGGWSGTDNFGGILTGSPRTGYFIDGRIWVGAYGPDGIEHFMRQTAPSQGPWIGWY